MAGQLVATCFAKTPTLQGEYLLHSPFPVFVGLGLRMYKRFVFVSCGQFTDAEKRLGSQISEMVKKTTELEVFFAEEVQDLNGLESNILDALRDCVGFITVMHPRGEIHRPGGARHVRASVWIEQEIAIATYIQHVERRSLPVIAFVHKDVGREGIRDLLQLNPIAFTDDSEVLAALTGRLKSWQGLPPTGLRVELRSVPAGAQDGHVIRRLQVFVVNDTNQTISDFAGKVCLPRGVLAHWSAIYADEAPNENRAYRCFRFDGRANGINPPREARCIKSFDYCTKCAAQAAGGDGSLVSQDTVTVKLWFENREYSDQKTIEELAREREERGG